MTIQLTRAQGEKLLASIKGRATKYRNQKVKGCDADGNVITFDSKREARRWGELQALEKQGVITNLVRQVPFKFALDGRELKYKSGRAVRYLADFQYVLKETGEQILEDVKSEATKTAAYKLKWALVKLVWGLEIQEI